MQAIKDGVGTFTRACDSCGSHLEPTPVASLSPAPFVVKDALVNFYSVCLPILSTLPLFLTRSIGTSDKKTNNTTVDGGIS